MFCVYLTCYFGDKLPRRYIGSTKISNIAKGYHGSVKSKAYAIIFRNECIVNPSAFKTRILSKHNTIEEALCEELRLQIKYDAVRSAKYMNMAYAQINGFFGRDVNDANHPFFNKKHSDISKAKISATLKQRYSEGQIISPFALMSHAGSKNGFYGKNHSEETKAKMRKPKRKVPKWTCPHCSKPYDGGNLKQHLRRQLWDDEKIENFIRNYK